MNNILLVRPRPHKETIGLQHVMICEPLELEYLVANLPQDLKSNFKLTIVDCIVDPVPLEKHVEKMRPTAVVFTGYNTHVNVIRSSCQWIKAFDETIVTAVGGVHVEVVEEDFICPEIDLRFSKNGIDAFNYMVKSLDQTQSIAGVQNWIDGQVKRGDFPYKHPDRLAVAKYRSQYYYMFHNPCALVKTSYGCPFSCSFCFCKEITGGQYFTRDLEDVMEELAAIPEREIYIVDDDFLFSRDRIERFIRLLKERGLDKQFLVYGRADFIAKNPDLMADFKAVGLHAVIVGLESVREADLVSYNKRTDIAINEKALAILKDLDIECYGTLIIPLDFTPQDFGNLKRWLRKMALTFVNLQPLTPLKGTAIYADYEDAFIEDPDKFERWDMAHVVLEPIHMSKRQFYIRLLRLYYDIVMQPRNVVRLLKKYGLKENWKLFWGSNRVAGQYLMKILKG